MRMKALVLGMVVVLSVGVSMGSGQNENAFSVLCDVLKHAKRLLNKTGTQSGTLKEALYGSGNRALFSMEGPVTLNERCNHQTQREHFCTYYRGGAGTYGCFADSLAGTLLCTCTPGNGGKDFCSLGPSRPTATWSGGGLKQKKGLFQNIWNEVREKCFHRSEAMHGTREEDLVALEKATQKVRNALRQGYMGVYTLFYFGDGIGRNGCSGSIWNNVCAGYYGVGNTRHNVHIPWLGKIQQALEELKKEPQTVPVTTTPREPEALKDPEVSETENQNITTAEEHMEETHTPGTPSSTEHQPSPTSRSKRSTTSKEGPVTTSTAPDDTSTTDDQVTLDPTAAPFSLPDGADLLTPLGLFMAASSFF